MLLLRQQIWRKTWESLKEWWEGWWEGCRQPDEPFDLEAAFATPQGPAGGL
jgi:hypothetical protein